MSLDKKILASSQRVCKIVTVQKRLEPYKIYANATN